MWQIAIDKYELEVGSSSAVIPVTVPGINLDDV